ncbi:UDP-glucosyltransferase 2-like [Lycorma delicatula]|uniref:UDP-glucosyltransferase 2-like n=1 Tax=Lycorma delicatula TaxID=130591 RepID=UPI003F5161E2
MMMKISFVPATLLLLSWFGCTTTFVESANILAVVPFNGRSHYIVIEALLKGLAAKGHQVTVFSSFPQKKPVKNLTDIDVSYLTPTVVNGFTLDFEIQDMLDKAKNGFIYFSFGSVFKSASMEKHMLDAFLKAFSKLPQLIIWKFEEEIDNIPPNLIIKKWWPQRDIFGHKNIKAFITHGGLSSILEGVNAGIPILGIPLFADQPGNINNLVRRGAGIQLNLEDITFDNVYNALTRLINDKSYMENAKMMSHQFKDRPMSALENAIFWVEYVLRHKGAYHMHSTAADLPLHQLLLLDVIAFLLISFFIFLYLIYIIFKVFYSHIIKRNKTKKVKFSKDKKKQ